MTDAQKKFVDLAKQYETIKDQTDVIREQLNAVMVELGINSYVQDPSTLTVYKIIKPNGTFTYFRDIGYKRTALEGEKGGVVLAKKEAEEAGFILKR